MRHRFVGSVSGLAGVIGCVVIASVWLSATQAQPAPKMTPWGEPDLQGIWSDLYQTPLQRPAQYRDREFLTDEEVAALDRQRGAIPQRPRVRPGAGSEADVAGAYGPVWVSVRPTGRRTSLIVDPPDGRIPPLTPEVQQRREAMREYTLALLQHTLTCKNQERSCAGGTYGPPSPRRDERPPFYSTGILNRANGPEDRNLGARCLSSTMPDLGGGGLAGATYRRIVQSPGVVSIFHDVGQGQGFWRTIPVTDRPHLPQHVREPFGDARGRWDGRSLVVDITNFTPYLEFQNSREHLHLVERWTPLDANTLEYTVTIEDPTTWTRPWTVKYEMSRQDDQRNRIFYEPRCHEGNFAMVGILSGARTTERAFAEGTGPHPAAVDIYSTGPDFFEAQDLDPLR